jgi:Leucine-rich repeat (LRR) protein
MLKLFILLLVVIGVGFVVYGRDTKNSPYQTTQLNDAEKVSDVSPNPYIPTVNTDTAGKKPVASSGEVLDLSSKGLTQTPNYVFEETNTEKLDLSNNKLTGSLQAEIRLLQNLEFLDLSNNQFTGLPAEIGQLKNLQVLNLSNNRITGLPLELGNLSNLKILNLKGNEYSEFDLGLIREKLPNTVVIEID